MLLGFKKSHLNFIIRRDIVPIMEKWRGVSYGPYKRQNHAILNPEYSQKKTEYKVNFSVGKSAKNIRNHQKILNIKKKCLQQQLNEKPSKRILGQRSKQSFLDDQSYDINSDIQMLNQEQTEADNAEIQKQQQSASFLLKSQFKGRPPVIFFRYPKCCEIQQELQNKKIKEKRIIKVPQFNLKYRIYGSHYRCIMNAFQFNGYQQGTRANWDVFFDVRGSQVHRTYRILKQHQKFNHFAGCWHIGRKDQLYYHIQRQRKLFGNQYNFLPKTYIFPNDYHKFQTAREMSSQQQLWIKKPVASSCGRNIKVISNNQTVRNKRSILISQYISNPHLINNHKYDLRIYVLITSFNPLRIHIYENGLVRFATEQYTVKNLSKKFIHLTNFSVNKHSKNFIKNKNSSETITEQTSKWSLNKLKEHYQKVGIDYKTIFQQIQDIVIKTCISVEGSMVAPKHRHEDKKNSGFQIYGFDILIDDRLKAWLIEVNVCPSLCSSSAFDKKIKHTLLVDILNLIGIKPPIQKKDAPSPKKPQNKRFRFKNVHNILNLSFENCLEMLQPEDWLTIFESEQQLDRLGNFKRIFPKKENIQKYQMLFQSLRYNNYVLWQHLLSKKGFLNRLFV